MISKPLIEVALKLTGRNFLPTDISTLIQLTPTKKWRRGDSIQGSKLNRKSDGWVFGLPQKEAYDLDAFLCELLDSLEPHKDKIAAAMDRFNLAADFSFGVYLRGEAPAGWFTANAIRRIAEFRANLDIDLILMG